ncbi:MAG TPA: hydroxymethylbilane synthase [Flavobacteriaceae bacterium]|nr:hydroxymethylbilane synthase [Flavobacteriaceae bacterium]
MNKIIRIGTRESELALWQAKTVQKALENLGHKTELIPIKSLGDIQLDKPLYDMGITGIFTKTLDIALLSGEIDIAVHSMKDVPTRLPQEIIAGAVLKRENPIDLLLHNGLDFLRKEEHENNQVVIATGSLRRKAQWLAKYPSHKIVNIRGNVNTRMHKLVENAWQGAIFAAAGLERIEKRPDDALELDWMLPAPAQGAMLVVTKEKDDFCRKALFPLNHEKSAICTHIEREFLKTLEGGCTAPIGALAQIEDEMVSFKGGLFGLDGKQKFIEGISFPIEEYIGAGAKAANSILSRGGSDLMIEIKQRLEK